MRFFLDKFKWVMLASGLMTCTMLLGFVAPGLSLKLNFGEPLGPPPMELLVRNWSALIGLIGVMLIYGALRPQVRRFALAVATGAKLIFVILVLTYGNQFLGHGIGIAVVADLLMVALFLAYLVLDRDNAVR